MSPHSHSRSALLAAEDDWGGNSGYQGVEQPPEDDWGEAPGGAGSWGGGRHNQGGHQGAPLQGSGYSGSRGGSGGAHGALKQQGWEGGAAPASTAPSCNCGEPATLLTSGPSAKNPGRQFYKARSTYVSQMCTVQPILGAATLQHMPLLHLLMARHLRCSPPATNIPPFQCRVCQFFAWADEVAADGSVLTRHAPSQAARGGSGGGGYVAAPAVGGTIPLCRCDKPARELTSRSERNPGRIFFKCASNACDFFVWQDEVGQGGSAGAPTRPCLSIGGGSGGGYQAGYGYGGGSGGQPPVPGAITFETAAAGFAFRDRSNEVCFK